MTQNNVSETPSRTPNTLLALVYAAMLISIWIFGPIDRAGPDTHWLLKYSWADCADVVLIGTSQVEWVLDADHISEGLNNLRVVNYGFSGSEFSTDYLDLANRVMSSKSERRAVVIGLDPFNTNQIASHELQFFEGGMATYKERQSDRPPRTRLYPQDLLDIALAPRQFCSFLWNVCPWSTTAVVGDWGRDENYRRPYSDSFMAPYYLRWLSLPSASYKGALSTLRQHIKRWKSQGIEVFAYSSPVSKEIYKISARFGYNPEASMAEVTSAGAEWIPMPKTASTFDGQHVTHPIAYEIENRIRTALKDSPNFNAHTGANANRCLWPEKRERFPLKGLWAYLISQR